MVLFWTSCPLIRLTVETCHGDRLDLNVPRKRAGFFTDMI